MSAFEELKGKLREIFQLDRNDLDFGLYRIMNLKAEEINSFLENDLLPQIKDGLKNYVSKDNISVQEELDKAIEAAKSLEVEPDKLPKVKELKAKLANGFDVEKVENEIYSDLYNFFKRYYSEGDFLSLRRYKEGVYALPYEGEEVKLHWANADQYYIKSGETLTNYTFKAGDKKVRFEVISATTEQNNNKDDKNRRFKLLEEHPVRFENNEYVISFSYLPNYDALDKKGKPIAKEQKVINNEMEKALLVNTNLLPIVNDLNKLTGTDTNRITTILKHLNNFTAKNTFDYFIHKDLGKFLRRELDFFIKNEIMHLDDIDSDEAPRVEQYLGKIKVLRKVASKIITFLAQLEDFQKKIWLKKKFILETNYCITLDRVPEKLYSTIATNEKQKEEWQKLFAINEIKGFNGDITEEFLKQNPYLVLDTAFFDNDFRYKLLSSIDNFDEQCDGLLVNADNFQYLNLSQEKQTAKVKCIYIDPPYNTGGDGFVYKDGYSHSSWLSMMNDRLRLAREYLTDDGVIFISIDEHEADNLKKICNMCFGDNNFVADFIRKTKSMTGDEGTGVNIQHENLLCYAKNKTNLFLIGDNKEFSSYSNPDNDINGEWTSGDPSAKSGGETTYFPIMNPYTGREDYPPKGRFWAFSKETLQEYIKNERIVFKRDYKNSERGFIFKRYKNNLSSNFNPINSLFATENDFMNSVGTKELFTIFNKNLFNNPKPQYLIQKIITSVNNKKANVLDYFAGSGTTGHAVINLNRGDNGNRKYILVEMGNYFDQVTKPRIQKVIYSEDWKDGKPVSRKGSSHCFKYIRLESYEDALDNLRFSRTKGQDDLLKQENNKSIKEQYMLGYMMDLETKDSLLNISNFNHPFDYEMKITRDGETKTVKVDLLETFNYLIGLNVVSIRKSQGIVVIEGKTRTGEKTLVLWRDTDEVDNATLDTWFAKQNYSTQDMEFDTIYVNGNNNLENLKKGDETWKVRLIEDEFGKRMFDVQDV